LRELASHRLDLFVTNFIPNGIDTKVFSYKSITKSPLHIYGSKQFKNLKNNFPQSLNNQPIILPTHDSKIRQELEHWSKTNNITFSTVAEAQDVSLKTLLAQEGLGVIPTTQRSVESLIKNKLIFDLGRLQGVSEEIFIITALRKMKNPIANAIYASEEF
jgi:LysR family transcriptional regulator, transcriptional activator of nhaA